MLVVADSKRSRFANFEKDNCYPESDALVFYYLYKREYFSGFYVSKFFSMLTVSINIGVGGQDFYLYIS